MNMHNLTLTSAILLTLLPLVSIGNPVEPIPGECRHELALAHKDILSISTLFISQNVNTHLETDEGIERAIIWARHNGLTKIYLETFRGNIWADETVIRKARDAFREAGFEVAGCITTTNMAKRGLQRRDGTLTVSPYDACFTSRVNQRVLQDIIEYSASLFDELIIDDFYKCLCICSECTEAKGDRTWSAYRINLMLNISRDFVIAPARAVNPDCRITIKYPNWFDHWNHAGYDAERQTALFDATYTGTETREPTHIRLRPQYGAYFLMRLVSAPDPAKNKGGWFDYIDTMPATYVEQARQTVLGGANELMLFHYVPLVAHEAPIQSMAALNAELPELFHLARLIEGKAHRGVAVPKPLNSSDFTLPETRLETDVYIHGYLGMLGIPLEPVLTLDPSAKALIGTQHILYDDKLLAALKKQIESGVPTIVTSNLLKTTGPLEGNPMILSFTEKIELMTLPQKRIDTLRNHVLEPLGYRLSAPARVSLHLYDDDLVVLENFNDHPVKIEISTVGKPSVYNRVLTIPKEAKTEEHPGESPLTAGWIIASRSLLVLEKAD